MNRFLTVLFAFGTAVISASALAAPEASAEALLLLPRRRLLRQMLPVWKPMRRLLTNSIR